MMNMCVIFLALIVVVLLWMSYYYRASLFSHFEANWLMYYTLGLWFVVILIVSVTLHNDWVIYNTCVEAFMAGLSTVDSGTNVSMAINVGHWSHMLIGVSPHSLHYSSDSYSLPWWHLVWCRHDLSWQSLLLLEGGYVQFLDVDGSEVSSMVTASSIHSSESVASLSGDAFSGPAIASHEEILDWAMSGEWR